VSTARLERIARALLLALAAGFVITLAAGSGSNTSSGRVGGDYPAFYGAGSLVADGDGHDLYDPQAQGRSQEGLYGSEGGYLAYVYPPPVALAFAPLSKLPYRASYAVDTALMVAALALALRLVRPMVRVVREQPLLTFTAALSFYPMLRAVSAGQNTAITLVLIAGLWRADEDEHDLTAGVCLGLLLLKPQLGLGFIALQLLRRRWRPVAIAVAVAVVLWAIGALVSGAGWMGDWWHLVRLYENGDAHLNAHQAISWLGAAGAVLGVGSTTANVIGGALAVVTALATACVWWRSDSRPLRYAVAAGAVLLVSPHTVFYDAGLLVLPAVILADRVDTRGRQILFAAWLCGLAHVAASTLGVTPVLASAVLVTALSLAVSGRPQHASVYPAPRKRPGL
jgi:hypothetical protein